MKPGFRTPPLFRSISLDVYLIDTSSWINMEEHSDFENMWRIVVSLIEQGRIVVCGQVMEELRNNRIYARLKQYEDALRAGDERSDNPEYLQHVGKITHDHPAMSKARGKKTPADPFVIALAEREGYVVVADETLLKRRNRKIPGVCEKLTIKCIPLDEFIARNRTTSAAEAG
jgi:rRNA-processing protein FCF1